MRALADVNLTVPRGMRAADETSFESRLLGAPIQPRPDLVRAAKQVEVIAPNLSLLYRLPAVDGYDGGLLPLATIARRNALLPFDRGGVARVIEQRARDVDDSERLSTHAEPLSCWPAHRRYGKALSAVTWNIAAVCCVYQLLHVSPRFAEITAPWSAMAMMILGSLGLIQMRW